MNKKSLLLILSLFLIIMSINVFGVLNDSIHHYYNFNEGSGAIVDSVGTLNGTATSLTAVSGKIGNAYNFTNSGVSASSYITLGSLGNIDSYSVSAWIKMTTTSCTGECDIFGVQTTPTWHIFKFGPHTTITPIYFYFGSGTPYYHGNVNTSMNAGTWYHLVAVRNGTYGKIYLNGVDVTNVSGSSGTLGTILVNGVSAKIGTVGGVSDSGFPGVIDEFGMWSRALTQIEITQLYNNGFGLTYPFTVVTNFSITNTNNFNSASISNFSASIIPNNGICYQESANVSNQANTDNCPYTFYNGTYDFKGSWTPPNSTGIDGNYSSTLRPLSNNYGNLTINYTPPNNYQLDTLWFVSYSNISAGQQNQTNMTLNLNYCYNYSKSINKLTLFLEIFENDTASGDMIKFYCYNGTNNVLLYNETRIGGINRQNKIYDEGIIWKVNEIIYNTTTGTLTTPYLSNYTGLLNITIISNNYFNLTYNNYNVSSNLQASQYQSVINFSLKEFDNNISLSNFTLNITGKGQVCNTTGSSCLIYPNGNVTYNFTVVDNTGVDIWTPMNTFSVSYLDNKTVYGYVTEHFINVTAKNSITNTNINNFSINLTDLTDGSDTRSFTTTNGYILIPVIHHTYNLTTYNTDYVDQSQSVIVNTSITANSIINSTFYLYKKNSITFNVYDVSTLLKINTTTSNIFMQGQLYTYSISTPNGTWYQETNSDVYSITVSNNGYANAFQTSTLTGSEHLDINFYLINTSNNFIFYLKAKDGSQSGNFIPQTTCTFYYPNNGSTITIGSFITDFSGAGSIYLDTTKTYTYTCQATSYIPYSDSVKPIVASSPYTILMSSEGNTPFTNVLNGLIIDTSSSYSYPATQAYFYYTLNSVNGTTQFFGLSTNYKNNYTYFNATGSPSGGDIILTLGNFDLINRTVVITYWYKVVGYNVQSWNETYYLPVVLGGNMTLSNGIFLGNNSITDLKTTNPTALGFIAILIPIIFMIVLHMFGMPKLLVILAGLLGNLIVLQGKMFETLPMGQKLITIVSMVLTLGLFFLIADNKDSMGMT